MSNCGRVAVIALSACLTTAADVVDRDKAMYVGGTPSGLKERTEGRLGTTSEKALLFDAGHKGAITIPYSEISSLVYGPFPSDSFAVLPRASAGNRGYVTRDPRRYRWSGVAHSQSVRQYLQLSVGQRESGNRIGVALFELGREIVRPTLEALERHTGLTTEFLTVEACVQGRSGDECGYGDPQLLKGKTTVFLDIGGSGGGGIKGPDPERVARESQQRIVSAVDAARLGLKVVANREEASVILNFQYNETGCVNLGPLNPAGSDCHSDRAVGEVYVVGSAGFTVVMLFDEERRPWKAKLATRYASAFIRAYKQANALK